MYVTCIFFLSVCVCVWFSLSFIFSCGVQDAKGKKHSLNQKYFQTEVHSCQCEGTQNAGECVWALALIGIATAADPARAQDTAPAKPV